MIALIQLGINDLISLGLIVSFLAASVPFVRNKRKDIAITDLEAVVKSRDEYVRSLERDKEGLKGDRDKYAERAHGAESEAAACRAKYEELQQYTAQPAMLQVIALMSKIEAAITTQGESTNQLLLQNMSNIKDLPKDIVDEIKRASTET